MKKNTISKADFFDDGILGMEDSSGDYLESLRGEEEIGDINSFNGEVSFSLDPSVRGESIQGDPFPGQPFLGESISNTQSLGNLALADLSPGDLPDAPIVLHELVGSRNEVTGTQVYQGRVPPHSIEMERAILGSIFIDSDSINQVIESLSSDDFYVVAHKNIYEAILSLHEQNLPFDYQCVRNELEGRGTIASAGGVPYLTAIADSVITSANVGYYCNVVRGKSLRRKVIHESAKICEDAYDAGIEVESFIDSVEQRIMQISDSRARRGFSSVKEIVTEAIKEIDRRVAVQDPITGVATGFIDLDMLTSGLQPGDLVIVAGRPSMGKTSLAMSMARYVGVESGLGVAVFSLEMSREQIVTRMLCSESKVDSSRVRNGKLRESEFPRLVDAAARISNAPIFVDDAGALTITEMRAKCRRLHREHPLKMIVVDYLQLMRGTQKKSERSREQEISEISRGLKALAKELKVPIMALSQLNRSVETRNDKRPIMADLRESGAIEQDADIICFVYRDEVYNPETTEKGIAELIIAKHRNGAVGTVRLAFQNEFTLFENLAEEGEYDYLGVGGNFSNEPDDEL